MPFHFSSAMLAMTDRQYIEAWVLYSNVTGHLIWWGLPAYIMWRPARIGDRNMGKRFFFSVICTWVALCIHRIFVGLKVQSLFVVASMNGVFGEDGFTTNDGQAGTAVIFVFGILLTALSSWVAWVLLATWQRLRIRRIASAKGA